MKIQNLVLAITVVLASSSTLAGWDALKSTVSDIGKAVGEVGEKTIEGVVDFSKQSWDSISQWGAETYNKAGAWTAESAKQGAVWLESADKELDKMLEPKTPAEARTALDTMAETALVRLFNQEPAAKLLFDKSYGYAVFDSRKLTLMLHTDQGAGVAVNRNSEKRTYMKMFGSGIAAGMGGKLYQQIILFENQASFDKFVAGGWEAGSEVGVVAGKESAGVKAKYNGGMAIYQIGEKGLLYGASITGSKYWVDEDLM